MHSAVVGPSETLVLPSAESIMQCVVQQTHPNKAYTVHDSILEVVAPTPATM
jgi:hypothetical protein